MAKIDYESSNFRNSAIDKMNGKFGKGEPDKDGVYRAPLNPEMAHRYKRKMEKLPTLKPTSVSVSKEKRTDAALYNSQKK